MLGKHFSPWVVRIVAAVLATCACLLMAAPAQAEPLWPAGYGPSIPAGPDVPGAAPLINHWSDLPLPAEMQAILPKDLSPCRAPGVKACIQRSTNMGWLMDGAGNTIYGPTPISHGRPGYETPVAVTRVFLKKSYHWSTMHFADMYWALFFNGDMATHIGDVREASHGCIRMTPEGAKAFYDYLNVGDLFEVVQ